MISSFTLAPPSAIRRFASLPLAARPARTNSCTIPTPSPTSSAASVTVGRSSPIPPFSNTSRAVASAVAIAASKIAAEYKVAMLSGGSTAAGATDQNTPGDPWFFRSWPDSDLS